MDINYGGFSSLSTPSPNPYPQTTNPVNRPAIVNRYRRTNRRNAQGPFEHFDVRVVFVKPEGGEFFNPHKIKKKTIYEKYFLYLRPRMFLFFFFVFFIFIFYVKR